MQMIPFGKVTDYTVSRMGLGCMSMSGCYGPQDDDECIATLHRAMELGVNFLDTSYSYGEGHNQTLIGKAIAGKRDQVVIHSKSGAPPPRDENDTNRGAGSEAYLRMICEESLKRLNIDCLDILCMSRVDREGGQRGENVAAVPVVGLLAFLLGELVVGQHLDALLLQRFLKAL